MLVTGGQVSMAISSGIVVLFTSLLFLSGYVLQQQTVYSLQAAIKPVKNAAGAVEKVDPPAKGTVRAGYGLPLPRGRRAARKRLSNQVETSVDWNKLGYVQLVEDHVSLCNAITLFRELHRLNSPAQRVILLPPDWVASTKGDAPNPQMATSMNLLSMAAKRYGVVLRPAEPALEQDIASSKTPSPLTKIFSLTDLDRALYLKTPGLLLDALPFDELLASTSRLPIAMVENEGAQELALPILLLVQLGMGGSEGVSRSRAAQPTPDMTLLRHSFTPARDLPAHPAAAPRRAMMKVSSLSISPEKSPASDLLSSPAYVRFSDFDSPLPGYDMTHQRNLHPEPREKGPFAFAWEDLYERFRQERMETCGFDPET